MHFGDGTFSLTFRYRNRSFVFQKIWNLTFFNLTEQPNLCDVKIACAPTLYMFIFIFSIFEAYAIADTPRAETIRQTESIFVRWKMPHQCHKTMQNTECERFTFRSTLCCVYRIMSCKDIARGVIFRFTWTQIQSHIIGIMHRRCTHAPHTPTHPHPLTHTHTFMHAFHLIFTFFETVEATSRGGERKRKREGESEWAGNRVRVPLYALRSSWKQRSRANNKMSLTRIFVKLLPYQFYLFAFV